MVLHAGKLYYVAGLEILIVNASRPILSIQVSAHNRSTSCIETEEEL